MFTCINDILIPSKTWPAPPWPPVEYSSSVSQVKEPQVIKDARKDICIKDVLPNNDSKQFGGWKKTGTEHMIVAPMDLVLRLLNRDYTRSAVIMAAADLAAAFDRVDNHKTYQVITEAFKCSTKDHLHIRVLHVSTIQPSRIKQILTLWGFPAGQQNWPRL